ncbi:MAG: hypothetical protein ACTTKL_07570 [Treponema sp.]
MYFPTGMRAVSFLGKDNEGRMMTNELQKTAYPLKPPPRKRKVFRKRASGMHYDNLPEKIQAIKEKYKNGVPAGEVKRWILGNAQREKQK